MDGVGVSAAPPSIVYSDLTVKFTLLHIFHTTLSSLFTLTISLCNLSNKRCTRSNSDSLIFFPNVEFQQLPLVSWDYISATRTFLLGNNGRRRCKRSHKGTLLHHIFIPFLNGFPDTDPVSSPHLFCSPMTRCGLGTISPLPIESHIVSFPILPPGICHSEERHHK